MHNTHVDSGERRREIADGADRKFERVRRCWRIGRGLGGCWREKQSIFERQMSAGT